MTQPMPNTANVAAMKPNTKGGVTYAPAATALPTDASTDLANTYNRLGYVSEDGIQPSRDTSIEKIKSWEGDVIAALKTDDARSFVVVCVEVFQANLNKFIYGAANTTFTPAAGAVGTKIAINDIAYEIPACVMTFEMIYGGARRRVVVPNASVVVTNENAWVAGDVAGYELTIEALKDASGNRVYDYAVLDDAPGT